jgi:hypothetical protein
MRLQASRTGGRGCRTTFRFGILVAKHDTKKAPKYSNEDTQSGFSASLANKKN